MTAAATPRRERLLVAAAELFAGQGFHAVGIDEIGAAAGISGPAVYRHFASKQAILEALCQRGIDTMLAGAREAAGGDDPAAALPALVRLHADFAVDRRALIGVWAREQRALPEPARRALRRRQREYELVWRRVVGALRTDLTEAEVSAAVTAALSLLNAAALVERAVPEDALRRLLARMALAALRAR